ncbi:MAG TPA: D-alanyl-D-alanine carboxypeptidase/D-alanyl-D-alanine-endopeptidase [Candidatus Acidoferrales bacterium]|nr:D-alanyl-D-alanine carboxypeptidase/D-alanyl-D-alanine-endopeptidase [Candidatus Acidoferrales bacterium]
MHRKTLRIAVLAVLASIAVSFPAAAQKTKKKPPRATIGVAQFQRDVDTALADPAAQKAFIGVLIVNAETRQPVYELNGDRYFTPASNTKLFTTTLAMSTLGPDYRFRTTVETHGTLDSSGRLRGDLVLVGRGDPDFSNRRIPYDVANPVDGPSDKPLAELADAIVAKGVKEIDGDIVGDDSYFPYEPYPDGWAIGDLPEDYGAAVSAICFDDNGLDIKITPGDHVSAPAGVTVEPWPGYDVYDFAITTGAADSVPDFDTVMEPGPKKFLIRGSVPVGHATVDLGAAMPEPARYTASVLKQMLMTRGIRVTGDARAQHAPPPPETPPPDGSSTATTPPQSPSASLVLAEHDSPPLIEIVRVLNKVSQNLHAEILLRTVAKERTGMGSLAGGLAIEQQFLTSIGVPLGDVLVDDGSGLSRENLVTPRAVVALLEYLRQQSWGDAFVTTLPVAGLDGTLEHRMNGTPAEGRIQAKTGSIARVQAISGFATTVHGEHLIFSMFDNHHGGQGRDAEKILDAIAAAMVQDLGAPAKSSPKKKHR